MEIKSFKKLKDNRYKVELDNNEVITLYDDVIVEYNLLFNKVMDEKKLKEIVNKNSEKEAYYLAIKMLNTKMRTAKEINKQLKKKDISSTVINNIIDKLYQEKYLDDERYIKAYVNDQVNLSINGPLKIKRELVELGFNELDIDSYLNTIDEEIWLTKIDKYITKKLKASSNLSAYKLKIKVINELVNKGYKKDMVTEMIGNYEFKNSDDLLIKEYNKIKRKLESKYAGSELNYYIKAKLLAKGFILEEIEKVIGD
ncbi:MAG: RecX family transcriptional regulator [Bacilli bacterium]|nr:RecX family transcriptional regulator [Bacilli bacterium]